MSSDSTIERRRSERVSETVPLVVRGIDLLGHPFEERTSTLTLNLQGCRYFSKHHLPRNSWISIEVGGRGERRNVRARVAWIHRPHSIRDLFQVAVELEGAADIWNLENMPASWDAVPRRPLPEVEAAPMPSNETETPVKPADLLMEGSFSSMTSYPVDSPNQFEPRAVLDAPNHPAELADRASALWRERLASEMAAAQREWDELLQSSIDRTLHRLAEQLPERAQEAVRATEERMKEQFANLGQMLAQISSESQNALAGVKASIDQEIWRARDTIENTRQQLLDRLASEADARVAAHAARVPELLRELSGREEQMAESLRLHRERLRQASDSSLRDIASQAESAVASVRADFETARVNALGKWNEELEALSARAGHAAGESISRTAEWVQQETRERLQVLAEQTHAAATAKFEEETAKATSLFATHLDGNSIFHLAHVHQQLDGVASDLAGKARTQLAEAAEAAAASFGQVLRDISTERTQEFGQISRGAFDEQLRDLETHRQRIREAIGADSATAIQHVHEQAVSQMHDTLAQARDNLAAESAATLDAHRMERETRTKEWSENIGRLAEETVSQANGRIQTAADSWTVSSVRRLNEHGQNVIDSLMRSADQALRDSASKIFEGLAVALREQGAPGAPLRASVAAAAAPFPEEEPRDPISPQQEGQSLQHGA